MSATLPELLLGDWNVYQLQTFHAQDRINRGLFVGRRKANADNLGQMEKLIAWCRLRHVEPRLWLFFLFKSRQWKFPPKFDDGNMLSEKQLAKYRALKTGLGFFRRRTGASALEGDDAEFDPNRDMAPHAEALKQRYLAEGQIQRCLDETLVNTLGYHPRSPICGCCPAAYECAVRLEGMLPFPILALRAGRISQREAERMARPRE